MIIVPETTERILDSHYRAISSILNGRFSTFYKYFLVEFKNNPRLNKIDWEKYFYNGKVTVYNSVNIMPKTNSYKQPNRRQTHMYVVKLMPPANNRLFFYFVIYLDRKFQFRLYAPKNNCYNPYNKLPFGCDAKNDNEYWLANRKQDGDQIYYENDFNSMCKNDEYYHLSSMRILNNPYDKMLSELDSKFRIEITKEEFEEDKKKAKTETKAKSSEKVENLYYVTPTPSGNYTTVSSNDVLVYDEAMLRGLRRGTTAPSPQWRTSN